MSNLPLLYLVSNTNMYVYTNFVRLTLAFFKGFTVLLTGIRVLVGAFLGGKNAAKKFFITLLLLNTTLPR